MVHGPPSGGFFDGRNGGDNLKISDHLASHETECRCGCGFGSRREDFDPALLLLFEKIRYLLNLKRDRTNEQDVPISISGPARCEAHNATIKNSSPGSKHCDGKAFDIFQNAIPNREFHDSVLQWYEDGLLPELGGLGEYSNRIHIDTFHDPDGHLRRWKG